MADGWPVVFDTARVAALYPKPLTLVVPKRLLELAHKEYPHVRVIENRPLPVHNGR